MNEQRLALTRRAFLRESAFGLGTIALTSMGGSALARVARAGERPMPHLPPKVKRVIFLCMAGGPSQFESFDNKPELTRLEGQPMPDSFTKGQPIAQLQGEKLQCWGPQFPFKKWGESGQEISTLFPNIGGIADKICIVRSMHTDQINHDPAHTVMNTGTSISGRPSMGSWVVYGLGRESEDLPAFVVLTSKGGRNPQPIAQRQWSAGFLPSRYQGVQFFSQGDPVHYVRTPEDVSGDSQRRVVSTVRALDALRAQQVASGELETRIAQYEMAFRMQTSVPDLVDFSDEPQHVLDMYGTTGNDGTFAANCLLARRLAERGVRFIHLYHRGWDHHNDLAKFMTVCSGLTDQPSAALVRDLEQRGMLDETLIIWSGEFGRTPMVQTNKGGPGRDHHMRAFSLWLAGGGIRGGLTYGATDELGYNAVENPVHVHDLHATMLHQLGLDHERLTFRYRGRDFRLTDVAGEVLEDILV
ncbi:MAG: DUF1501 domain-containing protein [Planctomycetota bacterium]